MIQNRPCTASNCQEIWCFGTNGKTFLNAVSEARVAQIARSYGCTPLAAWLLDCVFTGLLHPPGFKCLPTANAPSAQAEESADWPEWARGLVEDVVGVALVGGMILRCRCPRSAGECPTWWRLWISCSRGPKPNRKRPRPRWQHGARSCSKCAARTWPWTARTFRP